VASQLVASRVAVIHITGAYHETSSANASFKRACAVHCVERTSYCKRTSSESTIGKARQRISLFNRSLCYCVMQTNERSGMQNRTIIHGFPLLFFFFPLFFNAKLTAIKYFIQAAFTLTCYLSSSCPGLYSSDVIAGNARGRHFNSV
jgi:hypothetical protein